MTYWQNRFELLEQATNQKAEKAYREIEGVFSKSQVELQKEIDVWIARVAKNNQLSITEAQKLLSKSELQEFKWDVEEYIKYGRENGLDGKWLKELENASAKYHINRLEGLKIKARQIAEKTFAKENNIANDLIKTSYRDNYYHSIFELNKGVGVGTTITAIDESKLSKIIAKPWAGDGKNFSDRVWQTKNQMVDELHRQLTRSCILGDSPEKAIKDMTRFVDKKYRTAKAQASRLVMTESAFFSSAAKKEGFKELNVEEFEIVATLDSSTSEICQQMDTKHFPMSEYQVGITAPPFHVYCRSTTCPYFEDEFTIDEERAARDEEGNTEHVPANMSYKEWYDKYVDVLDKSEKPVIIKDAKDFTKISIDELKQWEKDYNLKNKVNLTDDELKALEDYGEGAYDVINSVERFEKGSDNYNKMLKSYRQEHVTKAIEQSKHLEKAINKFNLDEDIVVHRIDRNISYITGTDNSIDELQKMIGKTYIDKGYTSTSLIPQTKFAGGSADAVHIEITVPKKSKGAYIDKYVSKNENEFLLNKNTKFYVTDAGERKIIVDKYDFKARKFIKEEKIEKFMKVQVVPDKSELKKVANNGIIDVQKESFRDYKDITVKTYKKFQNLSDTVYNNLKINSPDVLQSLNDYTNAGYSDINKCLIKKDGYDGRMKDVANLEKIMDMYSLDEDIIVYRGTKAKHYRYLEEGDVFEGKVFYSTSYLKDVADGFANSIRDDGYESLILKIKVPKNTKSFFVGENGVHGDEGEFILSHKLKYKIIKKNADYIEIEVYND